MSGDDKWDGEVTVPRRVLAEAYRLLKRHYASPELRREIDALLSAPSHELPAAAAWIEFSKANGETSEGVMRRALGEIASMSAVSMLTAAPNEMARNALAAEQALAAPSSTRRTEPMKYLEGISDLPGLVEALGDQKQCDEDGVLCEVSRQAVEEARTVLGRMVKDQESIWRGEAVPSATLPHRRFLNHAIWKLGLEQHISEKVTPYGSRGEMIEHIVAFARDEASATTDGSTNG